MMAGTSSSGKASISARSLSGGPKPCHNRMGGLDTFGGTRSSAGTSASRVSSVATAPLEPLRSAQRLAPCEVPATHQQSARVNTRRGTSDRLRRLFIPMSSSAVEQTPREHQREQDVTDHCEHAAG